MIVLTVLMVLGLSGVAMATTVVDIDQTGGAINPGPGPGNGYINWFYVYQKDVQTPVLTIDITQTAGTWNEADARQEGAGLTTTIRQRATGSNTSITEQGTPGHSSNRATVYMNLIDVDQTADGGDNYALILQQYTAYKNAFNDFRVKQVAGTYNYAEMTGNTTSGPSAVVNNKLAIDQDAAGSNYADLYVTYMNNEVVGADSSGNPLVFPDPATQISYGGNNELCVDQYGYLGGHTAGLYQSAAGDNYADINQFSRYNSLGVYQVAGIGGNELHAYQGGNGTARVVQDAYTDNYANVYQNSSAKLVGANSDGSINYGAAATQISSGSYNELRTYQSGDNNEIGLYQSTDGYNFANITQTGDNNSLGVYQTNTYGSDFNSLTVIQNGDSSATVIQNTFVGNGIIIINQS